MSGHNNTVHNNTHRSSLDTQREVSQQPILQHKQLEQIGISVSPEQVESLKNIFNNNLKIRTAYEQDLQAVPSVLFS